MAIMIVDFKLQIADCKLQNVGFAMTPAFQSAI